MKCRSQKDVLTQVPSTMGPAPSATFEETPQPTTQTEDNIPKTNVFTNDSESVEGSSTLKPMPTVRFSGNELASHISPEVSGIDIDNKLDVEGTEPASSIEDFSGFGSFDASADMPLQDSNRRSKTVKRIEVQSDDEDEEDLTFDEGSGNGNFSEQDYSTLPLELETVTSDFFTSGYDMPIHVEVVYCVCESWEGHWKRSFRYPDLSCLEVNRIVPVLSVAICIVTAGGAVLSGVLIYLLWASKSSFYHPVRTTEVRPIIFSSNLKRSHSVHSRTNGAPVMENGGGFSGRNGNSAYSTNYK